jgi:hypothetical protein
MFADNRRLAAVAAGLATAAITMVLDAAFAVAWIARHAGAA